MAAVLLLTARAVSQDAPTGPTGATGPTGTSATTSAAPTQGAVGGSGGASPTLAETPLERYLSDRSLRELLAAHLLQRLKESEGPDRARLADRLGGLYVDLLERANSSAERARWETRSEDLLKAVPEAESFELRLNLAKARYLQAEETAERFRLRLTMPEERQEAERTLRTLAGTFQEIGAKLGRRVETLDKKESTGKDEDFAQVRADLADARRLRSLAMYYAGWANYYTAFLAGRPQVAEEAEVQFGWLLNAPVGKAATLERLPAGLVRYEHVARAAIGCALCESLRGHDDTALRWLDAVEGGEGVSAQVLKQLFARRMAVLASAKRWADLEYQIRQRRVPEHDKPTKPLEVGESRLLAVLTLEVLSAEGPGKAREAVQSLADMAMTDLVTLGEIRHVQDLVNKYGTLPLGAEGFIVQYVRGMQAYDKARAAHTATGKSAEDPTDNPAAVDLYRQAGGLLQTAVAAEDAAHFPDERSNAALMYGLSAFYAGDLVQAADRFEEAHKAAANPKRAEDALWLACVALDKAIEGGKASVRERMNSMAALYLKTYPKSDRSAKLLLRQAGLVSEEKAAEILLGVEKSSALYEAARRQAASILYSIYRKARGNDRDFAALRFAEVSDELLRMDRAKAQSGTKDEAKLAVSQIIIRVRQVLDAVLGMSAPDLERAEKAFEVLDAVAGDGGLDLKKVEDELTFRRLQVALARSRAEDITKLLDRLHGIGGRYSDAADRLMYKRSLTAFQGAPTAASARELVRHGLRVVDQFGKDDAALSDPAVYSLYNSVAEAGAKAFELERDETMRDVALRVDRLLTKHGNAPAQVLRRFAKLSETVNELDAALDSWRLLLSGLSTTDPGWYEARFNSLRILAAKDRDKAREAMAQHKVLHPEYGPEPWGERLKELDRQLGPVSPQATTGATGGPA